MGRPRSSLMSLMDAEAYYCQFCSSLPIYTNLTTLESLFRAPACVHVCAQTYKFLFLIETVELFTRYFSSNVPPSKLSNDDQKLNPTWKRWWKKKKNRNTQSWLTAFDGKTLELLLRTACFHLLFTVRFEYDIFCLAFLPLKLFSTQFPW